MKIVRYVVFLSLLILNACINNSKKELVEEKSVIDTFKPTIESLKTNYKTPEWFQDAKLGIYTHWGPVTEALKYPDTLNNGILGWYGMQLYTEGSRCRAYHDKYWGGVQKTGYKDIIPHFKAENFDPEKWADLFEMAGAKFAGPVSTHHDNFFMWNSDINPYNAAKKGPKRDVCREVAQALKKRSIKFIGTFHHGFSHRYYEGAWNYDGAEAPELYWKEHYPVSKYYTSEAGFNWFKCDWKEGSEWNEVPRDYQEYWRDAVSEFVDKYHPDLIWFDFGLGWMDEDIQLQMFSNYYNKANAYGQKEPTVAHKSRNGSAIHYGTLDLERGNMPRLTAYPWLSDTSPSSWFYYPNAIVQSNDVIVDMFVDIVSKNGCMLLNVGPDHTGEIPDEFMQGLKALGEFNKINGEGIFNTRPWLTYGEGTTITSTGHKKAANSLAHKGSNFNEKDIRYTQSKDGKKLYAFAMDWPKTRKITLQSVFVVKQSKEASIELMGYGNVDYSINNNGTITISLPEKAPNPNCNGFKISNMKLEWQKFGHYLIANAIHIPVNTIQQIHNHKVLANFSPKAIKKASVLLGSKVDAQGKIVIQYKGKTLVENDYKIRAGSKIEIGDFSLQVNKTDEATDFKIKLTGINKEQITDLAIGIQRDQTILQLGGGYQ